MIAYKFLASDGTAPFTGFRWLDRDGVPVEWVEASHVDLCRAGVHACRPRHLPIWLGDELWEVELAGEIVEQRRKLVAQRGRLVRRVPGWDRRLLDAFAAACEQRTRRRVGYLPVLSGFVGDIQRFRGEGRYAMAGFASARAAELRDGPSAYEEERLDQAAWLAARLGLALAE